MSSSDDNVTEVKAQNQVSMNKQDDFDMVKLKKSLKQEQKRSLRHKGTKLTPAEIRSLSHDPAFPEFASPSSRNSEHRTRYGLASSSPPHTPDTRSLSHTSVHQSQQERRPSLTLPTPPQSPARERQGSNASSRQVIHAPKPMSGAQIAHLANSGYPSRTPSASSYRGIATYRGPEVTRTGSLTMFAHPSPQIVANPLSQFSRPRQSTLISQAPPRSNSDTMLSNDIANFAHNTERHKSIGNSGPGPSREHSPVRTSDSPVSMENGKVPEARNIAPQLSKSSSAQNQTRPQPIDTVVDPDEPTEPSTKQKLKWRKTFNSTTELDQDFAPLRKEHRRRTFAKQSQCLHAVHYDDTKPGPQPLMRNTLRDELPSVRTSVFKEDAQKQAAQESEYGQHPAVRPLSMDVQSRDFVSSDSAPSVNRKGKEREVDNDMDSDQQSTTSSVPSYSRCSCCGRVQKAGYESELSPVLENENIRTNFDFEATRMSMSGTRRSSVNNSHKYTPIIPMEVGSEMKQARIQPMPENRSVRPQSVPKMMGIINKPGDIIGPSSTPLAIMPKKRIDPRLSRFGSLHARKEDSEREEEGPSQPKHQLHRFGSLYGIRNEVSSQTPPAQPVQTAYQAQQAQQANYNSMPNIHRPVRSSRLAYQEAADEVLSSNNSAVDTPYYTSVTQNPNLATNPSVNGSQTNHTSTSEDDEDDFAVDLSSFDGSFVQRSLSRAATHSVSPPTTSYARNGFHVPRTNQINEPDTGITHTDQGLNGQLPPQPFSQPILQPTNPPEPNIGVALSTSSPKSEYADATRRDWPLPSPNRDDPTNGSTEPVQRHSTIVKIVPSAPISSASSQKSANGHLRLGDWILPESPKGTNAMPSSNGFGSASSVTPGNRPVAAA